MHLTKEQREEIKSSMSKSQIQTLSEFYRYTVKSQFHTELLLENTDWKFVDYKERDSITNEELYCECGRRLKYQYIIQSKTTQEIKKLGINHFVQHLGIPKAVANQVKAGLHKIDYWLDEILYAYVNNEFLKQHETIMKYLQLTNDYTKEFQMISAFYAARLPLRCQTFNKIVKIVREFEMNKISEEKMIQTEKRKVEVLNHMFKVMENRFKHVKVGECLDFFEILNYLKPHNIDRNLVKCDENLIEKIVEHFEKNTTMKLKILNERVYRIK